jgi:hypothetical protein
MEVLHTDLQLGKGKDPVIAKRIQGLTNTINELKELQVI